MENELVVQVSMKQEMELAMKLLEKDIHEKQVSRHVCSPLFVISDLYCKSEEWAYYLNVHAAVIRLLPWLTDSNRTVKDDSFMVGSVFWAAPCSRAVSAP